MKKEIIISENIDLNNIIGSYNRQIIAQIEEKSGLHLRPHLTDWVRSNVDHMLQKAKVSKYANAKSVSQLNDGYGNDLASLLGTGGYDEIFDALRNCNEHLKDGLLEILPCYTPNGFFINKPCEFDLVFPSGFICIDVNAVDNPLVDNFDNLQAQLIKILNVAVCKTSPFVEGYYCLIPTGNTHEHREYFDAIEFAFKNLGITVDPSCRNAGKLKNYYVGKNEYYAETATVVTEVLINMVQKAY